jgi:Outer membrane protein beta-barrel domain
MHKMALGFALVMLSSVTAAAQTGAGTVSTPSVEIGAGYSLLRAATVVTGFNMQGGNASVTINLNRRLGIVGDFGYHTTNFIPPTGFKLHVASYTFGPRVTLHRGDHFNIFAHSLAGVGHASGSLYTAGFTQGTSPPAAQDAFALVTGAGVDLNVSRRWAIRAVQADWMFTTFPNGASDRQHSLRLTFGVVLRFGG